MEYQPLKFIFREYPKKEIKKRSKEFYEIIKKRKSVRNFKKSNIDDVIM